MCYNRGLTSTLRVFRWYFIRRWDRYTSSGCYQLVFCPRIRVIIETPPEGSYSSFDLPARISHLLILGFRRQYHQLPHNSFVVIFRAGIDTLSDHIASVHVLLPHTSFPLLFSIHSFLLELSGFTLLLCLPPDLRNAGIPIITAADSQQGRQFSSTTTTLP